MVLAIALALGPQPPDLSRDRLLAAAWIFCVLFGAPMYWHIIFLPLPGRWLPMKVHATGVETMRQLPPGLVLTIEPLFPLEGGGRIDPRFAVGRN
jgi:hypothetical protein